MINPVPAGSGSFEARPQSWRLRAAVLAFAVGTAVLAVVGLRTSGASAAAAADPVSAATAIVKAAESGYVTSQQPGSPLFAVKTFPGPKTTVKTASVPRNQKVIFVSGGVPLQYAVQQQQALVAPLGWKVSYVQTPGTPSAYGQAFQQAIAQKPAAIELAGLPDATVVPQIVAARQAGIKLVSTAGPQLVHPGFDAYQSVRFDVMDRAAAALAISDSGGHANVLFVVPSGYTEVDMNAGQFSKAMAACSGCSSKTIMYSIPDFSNPVTLQANITSALQSDPNIDYIVDAFDQAPSSPISNAIASTGRTIKVILMNGSLTGLQGVAGGQAIADVSVASNWIEYGEVDNLRRVLSGQKALPFNGWVGGTHVFVKSNLPAQITLPSVNAKLDASGPYVAAYKQLWATGRLK